MSSVSRDPEAAERPDVSGLPSVDDPALTSALMVDLAQVRFALRARTARDAWGSMAAACGEFRSLLRRRDAVLAELRRRGLDFPDGSVEPRRPRVQDRWTSEPQGRVGEKAGSVDLGVEVEQLRQGLLSRTVIGQAQGIFIERHKVSADEAFLMLVSASSRTNRKLREIAAELVLTGELTAQVGSSTPRGVRRTVASRD